MAQRFYVPKRYILVCLAHLGFFMVYALRVNLSVALVAMVNDTHSGDENITIDKKAGVFNWDESQQGIVLSSFFYGYIFTQLPGGYFADKFGGKWVFAIGVFSTCVLTLLTPIAVNTSFYLLLAVRVLEGVAQGVVFPAVHGMLGKWAPANEKGLMAKFTYAGAQTGTVVMLPVASILSSSNFLEGWPSAFYVPGFIGILWCIIWTICVSDSPEKHSTISNEEKMLILESQKGSSSSSTTNDGPPVPWMHIFTSVPVWALIVSYFCQSWVWYLILTDMPSYFKQVLNFNLKENGGLAALPYLAAFIISIGSGYLADLLTRRRCLNVTQVRRVFTMASFYSTAICLVLVSYVRCGQVTLSVAYMVLTNAVSCSNANCFNHLDLAPRYAGVLMGITNIFATVAGCITPLVTGFFINNQATRNQYHKVFLIAAGVSFFGGSFYGLFCSGKQQPWNDSRRSVNKVNVYLDPPSEEECDDMASNRIPDSDREPLVIS